MLMPSRFTAWGHALTLLLSQTLFILGMRALPPSILTPYRKESSSATSPKVQKAVVPVEWLESKAKAFELPSFIVQALV